MKNIDIMRILKVSLPIRTKEGKFIYFVEFEGRFSTENEDEVNDAVQQAINHQLKFKITKSNCKRCVVGNLGKCIICEKNNDNS